MSCYSCKHYHSRVPASLAGPEEPPECGHPTSRVLTYNPRFPLEKGCKNHEQRYPGVTPGEVLRRIGEAAQPADQ